MSFYKNMICKTVNLFALSLLLLRNKFILVEKGK